MSICRLLVCHTFFHVVELGFVVKIVVYIFKIFENVAVVLIDSVSLLENFGSFFEKRLDFLSEILLVLFLSDRSTVVQSISAFAKLAAVVVESLSVLGIKFDGFLVCCKSFGALFGVFVKHALNHIVLRV